MNHTEISTDTNSSTTTTPTPTTTPTTNTVQPEDSSTLKLDIHVGSDVRDQPFFMIDTSDKLCAELKPEEANPDYSNSVLNVLKPERIGPALHSIYRAITNPDHGFHLGRFIFFSPNELSDNQDIYNGKMVDVAFIYQGMGHVVVMSYIPETNNFCFRPDGGSNGYERRDYYNTYTSDSYQPKNFPIFRPASVTDGSVDDASASVSDQEYDPDESTEDDGFDSRIVEDCQYTYRDLMPMLAKKWVF